MFFIKTLLYHKRLFFQPERLLKRLILTFKSINIMVLS